MFFLALRTIYEERKNQLPLIVQDNEGYLFSLEISELQQIS